MSRTFSKVMIICAMVAILPLLIVGTTFASFYSMDSTITVSVAFVDDERAANETETGTHAMVACGDDKAETLPVTAGQTSTVTIKADYTSGYEFKGWFKGSKEEYTAAVKESSVEYVATTTSIDVEMSDPSDYVAVYQVVKFSSVSYSYLETPTSQDPVTSTPSGGATSYTYGEALPVLTTDNNEYTFGGWQTSENSPVYTYATFDNDNVTLQACWLDSTKALLTLTLADGTVTTLELSTNTANEGNVYSVDTILTKAGVNVANLYGYKYSLVAADGTIYTGSDRISITEATSLTVKYELIEYTATVTSTKEATYGSATVAFTREDTTELAKVFDSANWTTAYSFWTVSSLSDGTNTYDLADVTTDVAAFMEGVAKGTISSKTLTATVTKSFTTFSITDGKIAFKAAETSSDDTLDYTYAVLKGSAEHSVSGATGIASTGTIYSLLGLDSANTTLTSKFGGTDETNVYFEKIQLTVNNNVLSVEISLDATINDLIENILVQLKENQAELSLAETITVSNVTAYFVKLA